MVEVHDLMSILPISYVLPHFNPGTQSSVEDRLQAIEKFLVDLSAHINRTQTDNRYYYNDLIVAYDAANPIPSTPPLDDMIAWDDTIGRAKYAYKGTWKIM